MKENLFICWVVLNFQEFFKFQPTRKSKDIADGRKLFCYWWLAEIYAKYCNWWCQFIQHCSSRARIIFKKRHLVLRNRPSMFNKYNSSNYCCCMIFALLMPITMVLIHSFFSLVFVALICFFNCRHSLCSNNE